MQKQQRPDLEIIIVNFNSQFWLKKALTSLKEHCLAVTKYDIIVTIVDNNSSDESLKMIGREFRWARVIKLPLNYGFAVANNAALKASTARYSLLLNSDVELDERSNFDLLIAFMDGHSKVGIVTPKVVFTTGEIDPACHRGEPTPWNSFTYFSGLAKLFPKTAFFSGYNQTHADFNTTHEVEACSGAALLARTAAFQTVGLLDERFFMYAEDLDWCKRFREAGYTIMYKPDVVVVHHKNKSGIKSTSQHIAHKTRKHFYDTMLQYYDKHYIDQYPRLVRTCIKYFLVVKKGAI